MNVEPSAGGDDAGRAGLSPNYPHQCLEQTVSRFLPNVMTIRRAEQPGAGRDPRLEQQLAVNVGYALQRLYAEQKVDGGWAGSCRMIATR
ncbi:MAG: hypothetical protein U0694_03805 [Anaerolineae bacterium]